MYNMSQFECECDDEIYTLLILSSNTTNRLSDVNAVNISSYQYFINWDAVLPNKKYDKYEVSFSFFSQKSNDQPTQNMLVSIDFGARTHSFLNGGSRTDVLGCVPWIAEEQTAGVFQYFYRATARDNAPVMCFRPTRNDITVNLRATGNIDTQVFTGVGDYTLILTFRPI